MEKVKEPLSQGLCHRVIHICDETLKFHFKDKPKSNQVYISQN